MTLFEAITRDLCYSEALTNQLLKSAADFGFDLNEQYPENLRIVDADDLDNDELDEIANGGNEYLEDNVGCKYYIMYNN